MADHVGAGTAALAPLHELIRAHVLAAERLHGDDTTVPVLAKGKTITGRLWAYVRDDRPFDQGQTGPPAVLFHYSRDRRGQHPQAHLADFAGILQADAYSGFNRLYDADRRPGRIVEDIRVPFKVREPALRAEPEFARLTGVVSKRLRGEAA